VVFLGWLEHSSARRSGFRERTFTAARPCVWTVD